MGGAWLQAAIKALAATRMLAAKTKVVRRVAWILITLRFPPGAQREELGLFRKDFINPLVANDHNRQPPSVQRVRVIPNRAARLRQRLGDFGCWKQAGYRRFETIGAPGLQVPSDLKESLVALLPNLISRHIVEFLERLGDGVTGIGNDLFGVAVAAAHGLGDDGIDNV